MTMLMALLLWSCTSDDITSPSGGRKGVSLAFNISTGRAGTRMSTDITHKNNSGFRDILSESLRLIPFEETAITSGANPLSAPLNQMTRYEEDDKHPELIYYYDNGSLEIPDGTSSFLCYCKEQPLPSAYDYGLTEIDLHFKYGYLTTTMPAIISEAWTNNTNTAADIKFEPVQINPSIEADVKATALATYLTAIANAKPTVEDPAPEIPSWSAYSQEAAQQFPADQNPATASTKTSVLSPDNRGTIIVLAVTSKSPQTLRPMWSRAMEYLSLACVSLMLSRLRSKTL